MHYTPNGKPATDRTRVGIIFSRMPPVRRVINALIVNERLRIYNAAVELAYPFGYIVLICIHTGLRRREVGSLSVWRRSSAACARASCR